VRIWPFLFGVWLSAGIMSVLMQRPVTSSALWLTGFVLGFNAIHQLLKLRKKAQS